MLNKIINQVDKMFDSDGKREYREAITAVLLDGKFTDEAKNHLIHLKNKNNLNEKYLTIMHKEAVSQFMKKVSSDYKISDSEMDSLDALVDFTGLPLKKLDIDADKLRKYHTIWKLEVKKELPLFTCDGLPLVMNKNEYLCWAYPSLLQKIKKVTRNISYKGLTTSIKIARGVHYRVGSLGVHRQTEEFLDTEDSGLYWMTNQRIGFMGSKKQFTLPYNKIISFELASFGLLLRKSGRENPYIVSMNDYEVPCSMISFILTYDNAKHI